MHFYRDGTKVRYLWVFERAELPRRRDLLKIPPRGDNKVTIRGPVETEIGRMADPVFTA